MCHTYSYDSFGNMLPTDNLHGNPGYSIDAATNRLLNGTSISYYPNGAVATANGHTMWYTAEGYLRSIDSYGTGSYLYNAQGERTLSVRNDSGDHSSFSASENVYLGGQPMAEFHLDSANQPFVWTWTNYVYADGQKIARLVGADPAAPAVSYYLDDQLGTAQMEVSANGTPTWQGWYTPFGQEITGGWASNYLGNQPADGTTMHYKFTGKERDNESGLDYFGARYYASSIGRWISPDWSAKREPVPYAKLDDPQSLNLYGYVRNNPLSRSDPDGHCCWDVAVGIAKGIGTFAYHSTPIPGAVQAVRDLANPRAAMARSDAQRAAIVGTVKALGSSEGRAALGAAAKSAWNNMSTTDKTSVITQATLTAGTIVAGGLAASGSGAAASTETMAGTAGVPFPSGAQVGATLTGIDASTLQAGNAALHGGTVDGYAADMMMGRPIEPIQVSPEGVIIDGNHRAAAAVQINTPINVQVSGAMANSPKGVPGTQPRY